MVPMKPAPGARDEGWLGRARARVRECGHVPLEEPVPERARIPRAHSARDPKGGREAHEVDLDRTGRRLVEVAEASPEARHEVLLHVRVSVEIHQRPARCDVALAADELSGEIPEVVVRIAPQLQEEVRVELTLLHGREAQLLDLRRRASRGGGCTRTAGDDEQDGREQALHTTSGTCSACGRD